MKIHLFSVLLGVFFLTPAIVLKAADDETPPTIAQVQPAPGTVTSLTNITVVFSEDVTGISAFDFLVNGAMPYLMTGGDETFTFHFEQPAHGTVVINWDINHTIADLAGNRFDENAPSAKWQYNFVDSEQPVVTVLTPAAGTSLRQLSQIEVRFNEAVSGVDAADLLINGTAASSISVLGTGRYLFGFSTPPEGSVAVAWDGNHQIRDFANPPNIFLGGTWNYTLDPNAGLPDVRINEFLTANASGLRDENNEAQDWIELHNRGANAVDLAGWSLTDDADDPGKWILPSTNLAPGQFLVIFASGKDRRAPTGTNRLHTNFQINSAGGYLALFNGESPRAAMTEFADFPVQRNDHSYGYDHTNILRYFNLPTPGAANANSQIAGIVPAPHFNVSRGWFDTPFTLYLSSAEPGSVIRYTTDGSEPTAVNSLAYGGPLQISNTTILRAFAAKTNMLPSLSVTHTYLFLAQVLSQPTNPPGYPVGATYWQGYPADYEMDPEIVVSNAAYAPHVLSALKALPSVSIATSVDNMFGPANGIYTHTAESTTQFRGVQWERHCSMEFIPTNSAGGFQANCGIRIQGNASRNPQKTAKHPFRLLFKGDYGLGRLEEEVFPDSAARSFNTLVLRADFNNSWMHWDPNQRLRGTRIRDAWTKDTWRDMGQPGSHSRYFHLFINGLYWGIYDFGERIDATFAANYLGGEPEEYDAIASKPVEATDGDLNAYNAMRTAVLRDQRALSNYTAVLELLDADNFADYMLLNFFGANQDWGNDSNWNAVRRRTPDGRFKYISWDGEQLVVDVNQNRVTNTDVPGGLHTSLINSPEYRLTFGDRAHKHLFNGGALTTNATATRWASRMAELELAMIAESARWGDYRRDAHQYQNPPYVLYTRNDHWRAEVNRLLTNYFPQRTAIVLNQLRAAGLYPSNAAPIFSQHGGRVARNYALTISATNEIYYTFDGSDPREFGTGAIALGATGFTNDPIVLSNSVIVKARALWNATNWSALAEATFHVAELGPTIRITEIMYNPTGGSAFEFLTLKNVGTAPLNLGNYSFDGIDFIFPPNALIAPGATIVLASGNNPPSWASRYPGVTPYGYFGGNLNNDGEKLSILDPAGNIVYSLDYDDENGWAKAADGTGSSLKIADTLADPDDPANWYVGIPESSNVVLNELLASGSSSSDWLELHNAGVEPANLAGWSLTDDSNPRKFVFPVGAAIPAGSYLVVWCDSPTNTTPGFHTGFALGRNGETISLFNTSTTRVDAITFGLQLTDYTVGRTTDGWKLNTPTPGAANTAAATALTDLLAINEWLADPPPGGDDWVELHNRSTTAPIALQGIFLGNGATVHQLNALSFVAPGGFVQVFATELNGPDHVDFKLEASGGSIILYDQSAIERDRVTYGLQNEGITQGRLPDGDVTIVPFPGSASPGTNNYVINYTGPLLNEVAAGLGWVELRNPSATPFDLSGMRLTTDLSDPLQSIFPASTSIAGNGYLVVTLGELLDIDGGEVHLLNGGGQVVDSLVYGFQVPELSIGRNGADWLLLQAPTLGAANSAPAELAPPALLRINEWLANPTEGNDWFELYNGDTRPVALAGIYVSDNPSEAGFRQFQFHPLSFIGGNGFVQVIADNEPGDGPNHVNFSLAAEGEALRLVGETTIDTVYFGSQAPGISQGRVPDGESLIVSFEATPTPAGSNYLPLEQARMNEVLPEPQALGAQAVEIYNPTSVGIDISGWFISNHPRDHKRFRIPDGTFIPAGGYWVFQGGQLGFSIGQLVSLSESDSAGHLSGRRSVAEFSPTEPGKSFGAVPNCAGLDFVELAATSLGAYNGLPRVGPLIITELMYHPPGLSTNEENNIDEFIELHNASAQELPLDGWELRDAVAYTFPADTSLPAGGFVIVVGFDPLANLDQSIIFRGKFGVPEEVALLGPWRGNLSNAGEGVALYRPQSILGERVAYADAAPWPASGDGDGNSLQRHRPHLSGLLDYGNNPLAWYADAPTAGGSNALTGSHAPVIVAQPISRAVPAGTRVEFNAAVCGTLPIGYQWKRDGADLPGASLPSFVIESATVADVGTYQAVISNSFGLVPTAPATLAIQSPPVITQQPQPILTASETNVAFSVVASGALTYQWRRNGVVLPGQTNAFLELPNVQLPDSGGYSVLVANAAGIVASASANLEVYQRVRVLTHPQSRAVNTNANVSFSVTGTGTGTLRYQWKYFGEDLTAETNSILDLTGVQLDRSGDYTVVISDNRSSVESLPATLTVLVRPSIIRHPAGLIVPVGSNVTFHAASIGSWPLTNRWRRGPLNLATNVLQAKETNIFLTVTNVQTNQFGNYSVGALNQVASSPLSSNAFLTVVVPPTNTIALSRTDARLTVQAYGNPRILYQWKSGDASIPGATNATYTITNIQMNQAGAYSVVVSAVTNTFIPPATFSANVSVEPGPPRLSEPQALPAGEFQFLLDGDPSQTYAVQSSLDLTNWATFTNVTYTDNPVPIIEPAPNPRKFYRAFKN